jgi:DNA-binding response OmpR family regulator
LITAPSPSQRRHLLIVDDCNIQQRILTDMLDTRRYRLSSARSGAQGYQMAEAMLPDLILLDVRLPDIDGYAACRLLKANPATAQIPVIFLSGAAQPRDRVQGLSVGGVDYVTKPFVPDELSARIQIHLNLSRQHGAAAVAEVAAAESVERADQVMVRAAKRYILEHLEALPGLAEIARNVGTYREKLSPIFRAQTGISVFEFIRQHRIARAEKLLAETQMEVQDVAQLAGFNNGGNFTAAFRAQTGVTPSAFRRRAQQQQQQQQQAGAGRDKQEARI